MGIISSYIRLGKLTNEMHKEQDVKASFASMQSKLDAMKTSMAAANAAQAAATAAPAAASQVRATATVSAARPANTWMQGSRLIELDLTVDLGGGVLIPVTTSSMVSPQSEFALRTGSQLSVTLDPRNPASTTIAW